MPEKTIGYLLLTLGLICILYSAIDVFLVFTKRKQPVQLFAFEGISINPSQYTPQFEAPEGLSRFIPQKPKSNEEQKVEIISPDMINQSSNLFAHMILMGFIATIGGRIASIGTQLVRPIVVHLRKSS